jgi:hypothetical protein
MSTRQCAGMVESADMAGNLANEVELIDLVVRGLCQFSGEHEVDPKHFEPLFMQLRRTLQMARMLEKRLDPAEMVA